MDHARPRREGGDRAFSTAFQPPSGLAFASRRADLNLMTGLNNCLWHFRALTPAPRTRVIGRSRDPFEQQGSRSCKRIPPVPNEEFRDALRVFFDSRREESGYARNTSDISERRHKFRGRSEDRSLRRFSAVNPLSLAK